jgi:hypothetical protein
MVMGGRTEAGFGGGGIAIVVAVIVVVFVVTNGIVATAMRWIGQGFITGGQNGKSPFQDRHIHVDVVELILMFHMMTMTIGMVQEGSFAIGLG